MTEERVAKIADAILSNHKEQRDLCMVKCDEIIADYAKLMVQIEAASTKRLKNCSKTTPLLKNLSSRFMLLKLGLCLSKLIGAM